MASRVRIFLIHCVAALAAGLCLAQPAATATPGADTAALRAALERLEAELREVPAARSEPLASLTGRHGLAGLIGFPATGPNRPPEVVKSAPAGLATAEIIDFRPVLALLSQGRDSDENTAVLDAQGPDGPLALSFRGGRVTLEHLRGALADHDVRGIGARSDGAIRLPVILWEDTVLELGPEDHLLFSRGDGAFLVSLGRVDIRGSTLGVAGGPSPHHPHFAPFLAVAGSGSLLIRDAEITGLGFGFTDKFAGIAVLRHPFMTPQAPSAIVGNRFENVVSVVLSGTPEVDVSGNGFHGMRGNALRVSLAPGARISGNLFSGPAPHNAIRVLDNSNGTQVAGNLVMGGARVGIVVEGGSAHVVVRGNAIWRRNGGGIKFRDAACGLVAGNLVLDMRQKGIELYSSTGTRILRNRIEHSRNAGLWISGQPDSAVTQIAGNVLRANGTGLSTATAARLWLASNDLTAQLPRLVGGDISFRNGALARDLGGETPILLTPARARPNAPRPDSGACGPWDEG